MSHLTPKAEELVQAGRTRLRPSDDDYRRVLQALLPRVGEGSAEEVGQPSVGPPAPKALLAKVVGILLGFGVVVGGLLLAMRPMQAPEAPLSIEPAELVPSAAATVEAPQPITPAAPPFSSADAAPVPKSAALGTRPLGTSRAADSLAEEVAILSRAGTELHAGRPSAALVALGEHQLRFPAGVLAQERSAARIQALCALGRTNEAKAELSRLARTAPNSPLESRARKSCGTALNGSE